MSFTEQHYFGLNNRDYHRIAYSEWGQADGAPVICVHGLTGNGHDFDELAPVLAETGRRVIAVDLPGRGRSDFLPEPLDYNYRQYCQDLTALLARLGVEKPGSVDWIGVSLGGLLGIRLAGMANSPVRRLVLNDVGPEVPQAALDFIHRVIAQSYAFNSMQDFETRLRETRGLTWGPLTDAQWHHMAVHNARPLPDGRITYAYDPDISAIFENEPLGEITLWPSWDKIDCPVLVIQGAQSAILTGDILEKMETRGPDFDLVVFEDCGHVPSLMAPEHIESILKWLDETQTS